MIRRLLKNRNTTGLHRKKMRWIASIIFDAQDDIIDVIERRERVFASRPKEDEPENAEDQHGEARRDCK